MSRVCLISPQLRIMKHTKSMFSKNVHRRSHPILGIGSLASVLKENGHEVMYFDTVIDGIDQTHEVDEHTNMYGLSNNEVVKRVLSFRPDIVGISCSFTSQFIMAVNIARAIKESLKVPIVVGGNHISLNAKDIIKNECFDYLIKGECEESLLQFLHYHRHQIQPYAVPGIVFKDYESSVMNRVKDLDDLPYMNWDLMPLKEYWEKGLPQNPFPKSKKSIMYETSRGCPERCTFCSTAQFFGKRFRYKSAKRVIDEITQAVVKYGVEEVQFTDDNIALKLDRYLEILDGLTPLKIHLCAPSGVRLDHHYRNEEIIRTIYKKMKDAGFYQITFAPESGNEYILNNIIKKNLDLNKMERLIQIAHDEFGFRTHAFFMLGFPYETMEQMQDTLKYAERLRADSYSFAVVVPFPPTEIWQWCEKDNLFLEGTTESDLLFGKSVIKRFDNVTSAQIDALAEDAAERLNARKLA